MRLTFTLLAALVAAAAPALAQDAPGAVSLTVYSTARPGAIAPELYRPVPVAQGYSPPPQPVPGYAMVKQERDLSLQKGQSTVRFSDVAALIDPTTVLFESLTDPAGTSVLEQDYQFDLVSSAKLMERYIGQKIALERVVGDRTETLEGKLLSTSGGIILQAADGSVQVVNGYGVVRFPELPGGLMLQPTLVWQVDAEKAGPHRTRVSYQTGGLTWWADYNLVFAEGKNANSGVLDVAAWVSIINQSGASYTDAALKLVAGDVQRAEPAGSAAEYMANGRMAMAKQRAPGFEEQSFFEYHLYTLGRKTTLPDNSTKQIELFPPVSKVPAEKVLVYYGLAQGFRGFFPDPIVDRNYGVESNKKVDVYLRFKNSKEVGLGMPLPSGRIRVNKLDPADKSLEFIGEDTIDHTPKDEKVLIKLGSAFDVVGERKQIDFKVDVNGHQIDETIEIVLRNHKREAVEVIVKENLYRWLEWQIAQSSAKYEKIDARTIEIPLQIAADGEVKVRYTVRYSW